MKRSPSLFANMLFVLSMLAAIVLVASPVSAELIANWSFNDGTGTDVTGNGYSLNGSSTPVAVALGGPSANSVHNAQGWDFSTGGVGDTLPADDFILGLYAKADDPPLRSGSGWTNVFCTKSDGGAISFGILGDLILPHHLPPAVRAAVGGPGPDAASRIDQAAEAYLDSLPPGPGQFGRAVEPLERILIRRALAETHGNQSAAADLLGLHRNTLRNKLRQLGMEGGEEG